MALRPIAPLLVFAAALLLAGCTATAGAGVRQLPPAVSRALADYLSICSEVGGRPEAARGIERRDLNRDGRVDYILNGHAISCIDAYSAWGDRAKLVTVFVANGDDATVAFSDLTWGAHIEGRGKSVRLWLGVAAQACGMPPAPDFASENFCDRALEWNPETRQFDYAPVDTVRPVR